MLRETNGLYLIYAAYAPSTRLMHPLMTMFGTIPIDVNSRTRGLVRLKRGAYVSTTGSWG
jgi:hypothetical protein